MACCSSWYQFSKAEWFSAFFCSRFIAFWLCMQILECLLINLAIQWPPRGWNSSFLTQIIPSSSQLFSGRRIAELVQAINIQQELTLFTTSKMFIGWLGSRMWKVTLLTWPGAFIMRCWIAGRGQHGRVQDSSYQILWLIPHISQPLGAFQPS